MISSDSQSGEAFRSILPDVLTQQDNEVARRFLEALSPEELILWTEGRTKTYEYKGQPFRMLVDRPLEVDDDAVVATFTEFGTSLPPRFVAKSRLTRDFVNPHAILVIQPNSVRGESNLNLSPEERAKVYKGDLSPIVGRVAVVMDELGDPNDITLAGASQGATVALAYGANPDTPTVAVSAIEVPGVKKRGLGRLGYDFMTAYREAEEVVKANFDNHGSPMAVLAEKDIRTAGIAKWALNSIHPDNLALLGALLRQSAERDIRTILSKGGAVVHSWAEYETVSPAIDNERLALMFESNPKYVQNLLKGIGHAAVDFYALNAVLARQARSLR